MGKIRDAVDTRALRFAIGFPLMLAAGFVVCAFLVRPELPEPLAVRWTEAGAADFAPFPAVVGVGAGPSSWSAGPCCSRPYRCPGLP